MVIFTTRISGIPCQVAVYCTAPPEPMRSWGVAMEDASPAEPGEYEIEVFDRKGYKAPWLARKLSEDDFDRLIEEASAAHFAERHGVVF